MTPSVQDIFEEKSSSEGNLEVEGNRKKKKEDAYVMKEVRASVCSVSALSATSRNLGFCLLGEVQSRLGPETGEMDQTSRCLL